MKKPSRALTLLGYFVFLRSSKVLVILRKTRTRIPFKIFLLKLAPLLKAWIDITICATVAIIIKTTAINVTFLASCYSLFPIIDRRVLITITEINQSS